MASWYVEQREARTYLGRQRRRKAWIALAVAVCVWLTAWGGRNILG